MWGYKRDSLSFHKRRKDKSWGWDLWGLREVKERTVKAAAEQTMKNKRVHRGIGLEMNIPREKCLIPLFQI